MHTITLKQLRENPHTGIRTIAVTRNFHLIAAWLEYEGKSTAQIRDFRVNSAGQPTFRCGGGYDALDADLLDGCGDGRTLEQFTRATGAGFDWH